MNGAGWRMLFRGRSANRLARSNGWPAPSKPNKAMAMLVDLPGNSSEPESIPQQRAPPYGSSAA